MALRFTHFLLFVLFLTSSVCAQTDPTESSSPLKITGETMGTYYSVVIESPGEKTADEVKSKIESTLAEFSRQMSTWDPNSEISQCNQSQSTDWFPVSSDFAFVVEESLRIHTLSDGIFDPTLAPLIEAWGFGKSKTRKVPTPDELSSALSNIGMKNIEVRRDPPAIRKTKPEVSINLSAIAPGFGIDAVAEMLTKEGFERWLVDIGGEARAGKQKVSGSLWKIGVESPLGGIHRIVELENMGIATSGDYRNFFVMDGVQYSHILDPRTGRPVPNPPASVSILHSSNMTADALATTLMALGVEKGMQLAEREGLDVMFLDVNVDGKVIETSRGAFASPKPPETAALPPAIMSSSAVTSSPVANQGKPEPAATTNSTLKDLAIPLGAALGIFLLAILGMSVGAIFNKKQLKGSCGGLAALGDGKGGSPCEVCNKPKEDCPQV